MTNQIRYREDGRVKIPTRKLLSELLKHRVPAVLSDSAVLSYLTCLDCPRALTVAILLREKEYKQICELEFNPDHYSNVRDFHTSYCATSLFKKYEDFQVPAIDKEANATEKLLASEVACWKTNRNFLQYGSSLFKGDEVWLHHAVRQKIAHILGDLDVGEMLRSANWGPGSSTIVKRREACAANKFQIESGITRDLYYVIDSCGFFGKEGFSPLWSEVRGTDPGGYSFWVGNVVDFVPKTSLTFRTIAKEPGLNLWFQKALGKMIRRRLRRVGINLNSQKRNQELAREGSVDDSLCTIDFSSASDTIAIELVRELLPADWFNALDICRSHYGILHGTKTRWEKFSSMGNGFTFELQSLIFFAIAMCCCEKARVPLVESRRVSVYGDDVILPAGAFSYFSVMCAIYGFTVNSTKSFISSDFRESCGEHFYRGDPVRPIYLKRRIKSIQTIYKFHNAVRRMSHEGDIFPTCDARFKPLCDLLVRSLPKQFRIRIPEQLGDGGFISNFDEACPPLNGHQIEGFSVVNLVTSARKVAFGGVGLLLASLWALEQKQVGSTLPVTSVGSASPQLTLDFREEDEDRLADAVALKGDHISKLVVSSVRSWYDLGPWV